MARAAARSGPSTRMLENGRSEFCLLDDWLDFFFIGTDCPQTIESGQGAKSWREKLAASPNKGFSDRRIMASFLVMSTVREIEAAIPKLSRAEIEEIREWIDDYLEEQLELTDDVKSQTRAISSRNCGGAIHHAPARIGRGRRAPDLLADIHQSI